MLQADQMAPAESAIDAIADVLLHDGVCVLPTDSVYGLSCRATAGNPAHRRIFEIKERPLAQTLPLFIADEWDLDVYGRDVPAWAHTLAQKYWPGALTLVVRASDRLAPEYVQQRHRAGLGPCAGACEEGRRACADERQYAWKPCCHKGFGD